MEKPKKSVLGNSQISWHTGTSLSSYRSQFTYHETHPDPGRKLAREQRAAERVIFDILTNSAPERIEELEIKHITGEK